MNETFWIIYLITVFDKLSRAFATTSALLIVAIVVVFAHGFIEGYDDYKSAMKYIKLMVIAFFICVVLFLITPTKKDSLVMIGGYIGQEIVQNERVQNVGNKAIDALEKWLTTEEEKKK